jgi:deoxyadenosine/deoxycytidine kinase
LNPDLYVQITCDAEEMLRRLRESDDQESYHKSLVKNPQIVYDRLARYKEVYEGINCEKRVLDTTNKSAKESAKELIEMIEEV